MNAADRAQARLAAAETKGGLRSIEVITGDGLGTFRKLEIPARNNDEPETGPARNCAAVRKSGRIDLSLTTE